jgi:hypothetical protein
VIFRVVVVRLQFIDERLGLVSRLHQHRIACSECGEFIVAIWLGGRSGKQGVLFRNNLCGNLDGLQTSLLSRALEVGDALRRGTWIVIHGKTDSVANLVPRQESSPCCPAKTTRARRDSTLPASRLAVTPLVSAPSGKMLRLAG